jgi:hypothetical protein
MSQPGLGQFSNYSNCHEATWTSPLSIMTNGQRQSSGHSDTSEFFFDDLQQLQHCWIIIIIIIIIMRLDLLGCLPSRDYSNSQAVVPCRLLDKAIPWSGGHKGRKGSSSDTLLYGVPKTGRMTYIVSSVTKCHCFILSPSSGGYRGNWKHSRWLPNMEEQSSTGTCGLVD